jgi:hypothetical protein
MATATQTSSANPLANQKDILFLDTTGFFIGAEVTVSDDLHHETGYIYTITPNSKITLVSNLTYGYTNPTVTAREPAGEHWYRARYAGDATHMAFNAPTDNGVHLLHLIYYDTVPVSEMNSIDSVDSPTTLTLTTPIVNDYLTNERPYITEIDTIDTFLSPNDTTTRTVNNNIEFVVFWMRGCPPCYALKKQMMQLTAQFTNTTIKWVEIQDYAGDPVTNIVPARYDSAGNLLFAAHSAIDELGNLNIGMDEAARRYPMAYIHANQCGPLLPAAYHAIGTIMPAVLCVYRDGLFIKSWCGVHTTGIDPVSTDDILDTCGPGLSWRLGESSIGTREIIINKGDGTSYPVWTVTGPGKVPTVINVTTGEEFKVDHDLVAGEAVIIDAQQSAHTCASTRSASYTGSGYTKSDLCPTCAGKGVIPAACETCGGAQICPTCHGTGNVSVWVPASTGSTTDIGGMYNLRYAIDEHSRSFWGFKPGANVIKIEMGIAEYGKSIINMKLVQRYDGI